MNYNEIIFYSKYLYNKQTMSNKSTKHHNIPLSIHGEHIPENIIKIIESKHNELHQILEVSYNSIRTMRKRLNWTLILTPEKYWSIHELQKRYFSNVDQLDDDILHAINNSFGKMIQRRMRQINEMNILLEHDRDTAHKHFTQRYSRKERRSDYINNTHERLQVLQEKDKERARRMIEMIRSWVIL